MESGVLVCSADGDVQSRFPATVITDVTMQEYVKMSAAEKASPTLPTNCVVVP